MAWSDAVDEVLRADITVGLAYVTPAGGAVVTAVAPCGMADRTAGTVGFTTSLGFGKKLERIVRDPRIALVYHAREHGFSDRSEFVLVQGTATVELTPPADRLEEFAPQAVRYLGAIKRGPVWDRLLREYYRDRVFVDVTVERVLVWPELTASGPPVLFGSEAPAPPAPQAPPKKGTGPRVDVARTARQIAGLPHRLLAYRGADGLPVVVPIDFAGHDDAGLRLVRSGHRLPVGGRRAGVLAHAYKPQLVGLATRVLTGWLDVDGDGPAVYAPHTSRGFVAPPRKNLLLVSNGLIAKYGQWRAARDGAIEKLASLTAPPPILPNANPSEPSSYQPGL